MRKVTKTSKETGEEYEAWVFNPDESKDYSDFRFINDQMNKMAEYMEEHHGELLADFLNHGQHETDFADLIIHEL